jgi:6,7-dimethyl-8-ribityllumazine synthase
LEKHAPAEVRPLSKSAPRKKLKIAGDRRYAIVTACFNRRITGRLLKNCRARLLSLGVAPALMTLVEVPGAFELALTAKTLARTGRFAAVICLGAVIRGETRHYELVCEETARGISRAGMDTGVPVIFGVLTCDQEKQALARCQGGPKDAGIHAANAAVWMGDLIKKIK